MKLAGTALILTMVLFLSLASCAPRSTPDMTEPPATVTGVTISWMQSDFSSAPRSRVFLNIRDQLDQPLTDFRVGNFVVLEDGVPAPILETGMVTDALSVLFVVDHSGSMYGAIELVNLAAATLIDNLSSGDSVGMIEFSDTVTHAMDFTTDLAAAKQRILASNNVLSTTALYQAVEDGANWIGERSGKKLLVILSDGADNMGKEQHTLETAALAVNNNGIGAYVVGLGTGYDAPTLQSLATKTGGAYIETTAGGLSEVYLKILDRFKNLYFVRYMERYRQGQKIYLNYGALSSSTSKVY